MALTYRTVVGRALAAGLVTGLLVGAYQLAAVQPVIDDAVALEADVAATEHAGHGHTHADGERFSRREQVGGGVVGTTVYTLVLAAVFGTVVAAVRHRLPGRDDLQRSTWLAAVGFVAVALVPALVLPANPPAVGDPDTVDQRTFQYLALITVGLVLVRALTALSGGLRGRLDDANRTLVVAVSSLAAFGALVALYPATTVDVGAEVPAALLWEFRTRSLGGLALLWAGLGLGLGWLLARRARRTAPAPGQPVPTP
jgi:predicted cobalt transporter CbtA